MRIVMAVLVALATTLAAGPIAAQTAADEESELLVSEARERLARGDYDGAAGLLDRALAVNPRRIDAYVLRATVHGVKKEHGQAVALMRRAQKLAPDNPDVLTALGSQLMLARSYDEGVPILERVVTRWPERYQAQVHLGHHYARVGAWAKAIVAFEAYFQHRPASLAKEDATHRVDLANAYLRDGNPARAREMFSLVLKSRPDDIQARMGVAWSLAAIDCRKALPMLRDMEELADRYPVVHIVRGKCALRVGKTEEALASAKTFSESAPDSAEGLVLLGDAYAASNNVPAALNHYERASAMTPGDKLYSLKLARMQRLAGKPEVAAERLKVAGPPDDYEDDWNYELAHAYLASNKPEQAREVALDWVSKNPESAEGHLLVGISLQRLGKTDEAVTAMERALKLDPKLKNARKPLVNAYNVQAAAAFEAGKIEEAEDRLTRAQTLLPNDPMTLRNLGAVRIRRGRHEDAISPLRAATTRADNDGAAWHLLGRAYAGMRLVDDAVAAYRKAAQLLKDQPALAAGVNIDLASAYLQAGKAESAVDVLDGMLQGSFDAPTKRRVVMAYVTAARAASTEWMSQGGFPKAHRLLEKAETLVPADAAEEKLAIRCDLALASTGAGRRTEAVKRLRDLEEAKARCPFPAPADELAVPILLAWNEGMTPGRADRALKTMSAMKRQATGAASTLYREVGRAIALRAAADAYSRGNSKMARDYMERADEFSTGRQQPEIEHNMAVIALDDGRVDEAVTRLERVAAQVPEAYVNLGIAYERRGDHARALRYFEQAASAGVSYTPLKRWIAAKRRFWGE